MSKQTILVNATLLANLTNGPVSDSWGFRSLLTLATALLVILFNGPTLYCFLKDGRLRKQPFSVYLICLLITNLLLAIFGNPLDVIANTHSVWTFGTPWCIVYHYMLTVISACQINAHTLISLNRVWAVTFPFSYRRLHSRTVASLVCFCMYVYVHAIHLPIFTMKMSNLDLPLEIYGCYLQFRPPILINLFAYALGLAVIIIAYPWIVYKRYQCKKIKEQILAANILKGRSECGTGRFNGSVSNEVRQSPYSPWGALTRNLEMSLNRKKSLTSLIRKIVSCEDSRVLTKTCSCDLENQITCS